MSILEAGPSIIIYHILPSILAALVYFLLASFFIFLFRIKRPSARFLIYLLALFKSVLALVAGARYSETLVFKKLPFAIGNKLYDPFDLIPVKLPKVDIAGFSTINSPWLSYVIIICLFLILLLLALRWASTAWFFKKMAREGTELPPELKSLALDVAAEFKIKNLEIILGDRDFGPLVIGIFKPLILIPKNILSTLTENEIKTVIGHELAHIKRRDNLWQWITLLMKDLLFFNPFARFIDKRLRLNKEIAADNLFLEVIPGKRRLLEKTLLKVVDMQSRFEMRKSFLVAKSHFVNPDIVTGRLNNLRANLNRPSNLLVKISGYICVFLFLWLKFWIAVKIGSKALFLLS